MIPKSLAKLGKLSFLGRAAPVFTLSCEGRCAAAYELTEAQEAEGEDWLPPLLGAIDDSLPTVDAAASELVDEDDASDEESDVDQISPTAPRDLHTLMGEIRTLTSRLTQVESSGGKMWRKSDNLRKLGLVGAGSAVGAGVAVAVLAVWGNRRRR